MENTSIDTTNFNLNTPVLVYIGERGVYIPEVKGYPPIRCYISIEKVITIMNRGIYVEFPKQSKEHEISKKIEEIMLEYEAKKNEIYEKRGLTVGTNIDKALDLVQDMNDTAKTSVVKAREDKENKLFDYSDRTEKIVRNLSDTEFMASLMSDDPKNYTAEDRLEMAEQERRRREALKKKKKEALQDLADQTEAIRRLYQDAKYTNADAEYHKDLDFSDSLKDRDVRISNPFYAKKKR